MGTSSPKETTESERQWDAKRKEEEEERRQDLQVCHGMIIATCGNEQLSWSASRGRGECRLICMSHLVPLYSNLRLRSGKEAGLRFAIPLIRPRLLLTFQLARSVRSGEGLLLLQGSDQGI
jgi:hypothetical protein